MSIKKEEKSIYDNIKRNGKNFILCYKKYNYKCSVCGSNKNLVIHHINNRGRHNIKIGIPPDNDINNLILLCRRCHNLLHARMSAKITSKKVLQYSLDGVFIKEYNSTKEAQRVLGIYSSGIIRCCNGTNRTSGGFIWKYKEVGYVEKKKAKSLDKTS